MLAAVSAAPVQNPLPYVVPEDERPPSNANADPAAYLADVPVTVPVQGVRPGRVAFKDIAAIAADAALIDSRADALRVRISANGLEALAKRGFRLQAVVRAAFPREAGPQTVWRRTIRGPATGPFAPTNTWGDTIVIEPYFDDLFPDYDIDPVMAYANDPNFAA